MHTPLDRRRLTMLQEMGVHVWARTPNRQSQPSNASPSSSVYAQTHQPEHTLKPTDHTLEKPKAPHLTPPTSTPSSVEITDSAAASNSRCADMDWEQLERQTHACQSCPLHRNRSQPVFDKGQRDASIFILGEAPGAEEDRQGLPFVGKSGQLLDRMLCALGGGPKHPIPLVYIANTLKCRPPANRNPNAEELTQCKPFWERQIALVQPKVILALGRFASQALLNSNAPLGKLRKQVHQYRGIPVLVSYHPAYLLRNPSDKAKAWTDLCLLQQLLNNNETETPA